jgi:hypothetical protein
MGVALPIILAATLVGAVLLLAWRHRSATARGGTP